jgi:hypothetical protein
MEEEVPQQPWRCELLGLSSFCASDEDEDEDDDDDDDEEEEEEKEEEEDSK